MSKISQADEAVFVPPSVTKHTAVTRLSEKIFAADLSPELCIGSGKTTPA
jgi:hypothetical protein